MRTNTEITFICYHYLKRADNFRRIWGHDWDLFTEHMDFFQSEFPPVSLRDLKLAIRGELVLPERCSVITFDDGLKEHSSVIAPYLYDKKIPAIFNVCSSVVGGQPTISQSLHFGTAVFGVRKMLELLDKYAKDMDASSLYGKFLSEVVDLPVLEINKRLKIFFNMKLDHKLGLELISRFWWQELDRVYPGIFDQVFMSREDLRHLVSTGFDIGLHTSTHRRIFDADFDQTICDEEIISAKHDLETALGSKIVSFAYPFGHQDGVLFNDENLLKIRATGIDFIFTTFRGEGRSINTNFLGRYLTQGSDSVSFLRQNLWTYEITYNHK